MKRNRPPSKSTCLVLSELLSGAQYGYALMKATGLKSGTLYPILMRLSDRGLLGSEWAPPQEPGRPPRQIYELTKDGRVYAENALAKPIAKPVTKPIAKSSTQKVTS